MSVVRKTNGTMPTCKSPLSNLQKLEAYSDTMATYAISKEKMGLMNEAASYYLKAADILLVICRNPSIDYPTWSRLSNKASNYHKKIKIMLANHNKTSCIPQNSY